MDKFSDDMSYFSDQWFLCNEPPMKKVMPSKGKPTQLFGCLCQVKGQG